jgi:hypothetical protein
VLNTAKVKTADAMSAADAAVEVYRYAAGVKQVVRASKAYACRFLMYADIRATLLYSLLCYVFDLFFGFLLY